MTAVAGRAFLDAADDLLSAQQRLMPDPMPADLRNLTMAYLEKRRALMDRLRRKQPANVPSGSG